MNKTHCQSPEELFLTRWRYMIVKYRDSKLHLLSAFFGLCSVLLLLLRYKPFYGLSNCDKINQQNALTVPENYAQGFSK